MATSSATLITARYLRDIRMNWKLRTAAENILTIAQSDDAPAFWPLELVQQLAELSTVTSKTHAAIKKEL